MKKVLVLGGTRYFGRELVKNLIERGNDVTVGTRGVTEDEFGDKVNRIKIDRNSKKSLEDKLKDMRFDVIYDNIAYSPNNIVDLCDIIKDKCNKYIVTSTGSVYDDNYYSKEDDYNPYEYPVSYGTRDDYNYGEGKKLVEAVSFQKYDIPTIAVRFPIVLGENDYTKRLYSYVENIMNEETIDIDNMESIFCFIHSESAGDFLGWLSESDYTGPINACDEGTIMISEIIDYIEKTTGKKARISKDGVTAPYNGGGFTMDYTKVNDIGYKFRNVRHYIFDLIDFYVSTLG